MAAPLLLSQKLAAQRVAALHEGALQPIASEEILAVEQEVAFVIRVVSSLADKEAKKERAARRKGRTDGDNPFLPYDPALFVTEISETHLGLLNKYPVVDDHLLIVTRQFVDQEAPLEESDFDAVYRCLAEVDGLAFYNAGKTAGASQRHRHLQFVPLPLAVEKRNQCPRVPIEPALELGRIATPVGSSERLPFSHAIAPLKSFPPSAKAASLLFATYGDLRRHLALGDSAPFNLILTRGFMLLVPRSREHAAGGVSINALGFAGALLARNTEELQALRDRGPLTALAEVAGHPEE